MILQAVKIQTPKGRAGVAYTLDAMKKLAALSKSNLTVRLIALRIISKLAQKNRIGEIEALHNFVRDNIRYVHDVRGVETLQAPEITLQVKQGDCDDKALLLAALLESVGYKTRFRAVGFSGENLTHVLTDVFRGGEWIPLETTMNVEMGWEPNGVKSEMILEN